MSRIGAVFILIWVLMNSAAASTFTLKPHAYGGDRNSEVRSQLVLDTQQHWKSSEQSEVALHWSGEIQGRRDFSFDIDRAWTALTPSVKLGRIHPWDLSAHPDRGRPYGFLAQAQTRNLGILPEDARLTGLLGLHYWSDSENSKSLAFGFSASPFFIPTMGSEVTLSRSGSSPARFGRRPPGFVTVSGVTLPLGYEIDKSRIWEEVVFQPQIFGQLRLQYSPDLTGWLSISRSPLADPVPETSGYLNVTSSDIGAIAQVRPKFPETWTGSIAHIYAFGDLGSKIRQVNGFVTAQLRSNHSSGLELGLRNPSVEVSLMNEFGMYESARYADLLLQASLSPHFGEREQWSPYAKLKRQLHQDGVWINCGLTYIWSQEMSIDNGIDLFGGDQNAYYGEWRTNDRIYLNFTWRTGS